MFDSVTPWTAAYQASLSPRVCSNSSTLSQWCHPTISPCVDPSSSCLQFIPASGSFLVSQFFTSVGQSIGVSASASVLPMNVQDWFPLGLNGWISLQGRTLKSLLQHHSSKAWVYHQHIWGCWYFSWQSWFQPVIHLALYLVLLDSPGTSHDVSCI